MSRRTHGLHRSGAYKSWAQMKQRCLNRKAPNFARYGGRGVRICERWMAFENFLADMGHRPEGTTLDRVDNSGNYEPGNCRWATPREQAHNRIGSLLATIGGETMAIAAWAERYGRPYRTVMTRLQRGWGIETALTTAGKKRGRHANG